MTYTVRQYLDAPLGPHRAADLEHLAKHFTGRPLADTVTDLRTELGAGIGMEHFRRLHILISHLYHQCGASIPLTTDLRAEVGQALTRHDTTTSA
jgi:hypothetical protein